MRLKQGNVFILLGAAHCILMTVASLYSLGALPQLSVSARQWNDFYFTFFLCLYGASAGAIIGQSLKYDVFVPQAILDALVGIVPYQIIFWAVRRILLRWPSFPWLSLLPGLFLVYYGFKLRRGLALHKRLEL